MFRREYKRRSTPMPFVIFRLLLSVTMMVVLGLGIYQAFRYFSGSDPLKLDPKSILLSLSSSKDISKTISNLWQSSLSKNGTGDEKKSGDITDSAKTPTGKVILKFAVAADSHSDNENLGKALSQIGRGGAKFVIGLGDWSDIGTIAQLEEAKRVFESSKLPYYLTAGDHDLWDARDKGLTPNSNFSDVFGASYQSFSDSNIRFVILYNSDNYNGVDSLQMQWLKDTLNNTNGTQIKNIFVFLHEPLYHPSSDHMMGKEKPELRKGAEEITQILKDASVNEVFAGDIHAYSRYEDPKTGLKMTTVGALTKDRNVETPSFIMVDVYENGGYNIQKLEVN